MAVNMLTAAIERGVPLVVLSPHLDDAALSCGALMTYASRRTTVIVATLFTEGSPPPYTLSARRHLHQVGAPDAETLYHERRTEDRAALEPLGFTCLHAGLTDAQFRHRAVAGSRRRWAAVLPELAHIYPLYRVHVVSGRVAPADAGTLREVREFIQRMACPARAIVLAPLAVGGHVDHVLVRTAAERSGTRTVYYSDFPYNQRHQAEEAFVRRKGLVEMRWPRLTEAKAELIRDYRSQTRALFPGGRIPLVPDVFFMPGDSGAA